MSLEHAATATVNAVGNAINAPIVATVAVYGIIGYIGYKILKNLAA